MKKNMYLKKRWLLPLLLLLIVCTALPVQAAERFRKVSSNMQGAVKLSSVSIFAKASGGSKVLKTLKFGEKVRIQKSHSCRRSLLRRYTGLRKHGSPP